MWKGRQRCPSNKLVCLHKIHLFCTHLKNDWLHRQAHDSMFQKKWFIYFSTQTYLPQGKKNTWSKKIKTCTNKGQPWNERKYEKRGMKGSNSTFIVPRLNATSAYKIELVKRSCQNTIVFLDSPTYTPPTKDYSWLGPQKIVVRFKTQHKQYTLWSWHTFMSQCHANFYYLFPQVGNVAQKQISPQGKEKRRHT